MPTTYGTTLPDGTHTQLTAAELKSDSRPIAYGSSHNRLQGYLTVSLTSRQSLEVFLRRVPQAVEAAPLIREQNQATLRAAGDLRELQRGYHLSRTTQNISRALGSRRASSITHPAYLAAVQAAANYNALPPATALLVRNSTNNHSENPLSEDTALAPLRAQLPLLMFVAVENYRTPSPAAQSQLVAYVNSLTPIQKETV
jgi:hypothetical protein